jgi:hypothetical protein
LTPTNSVRPIVVATPTGTSSLTETTDTVSSLYTNSEPFLCADYEYDFIDLNGNPLPVELSSKLSVDGDKIKFDQNGYDDKVHHLQIKISTQAGFPILARFDIVQGPNNCRAQNL